MRAGARVFMTGRNPNRLAAARAAVHRRVPDAAPAAVETLLLDTTQPRVGARRRGDACAGGEVSTGVLLNAGIVHPPKTRETTVDGHEVVFATNVLGHFALAGEMLTTLAETLGTHGLGRQHVDRRSRPYDPVDPQLVTGYSGWRAYVQSKIATTALGFEADRRLRAAEVPVTSVVAHPGYSTSGRTPGHRRRQRPDEAHAVRRQPAGRDRPVEGARRLVARARARRPRRSRAASSGARRPARAASRGGRRRRRSPATSRSPSGCGARARPRPACGGRSPRRRRSRR